VTIDLTVAVTVLSVLTLASLVLHVWFELAWRRSRAAADRRADDALRAALAGIDERLAVLGGRQDDLMTVASEAKKSTEAGTSLLTRQFALVRDRQARLEQVFDTLRTRPTRKGTT
jgi:hypothetical protein